MTIHSTQKQCDALKSLCDSYDLSINEFFFDRNSRSFSSVIDFYRTGKLHLIDDICVVTFAEDLAYWQISEKEFDVCCRNKYYEKKENVSDQIKREMNVIPVKKQSVFGQRSCSGIRRRLWHLFEDPHSSPAARVDHLFILMTLSNPRSNLGN